MTNNQENTDAKNVQNKNLEANASTANAQVMPPEGVKGNIEPMPNKGVVEANNRFNASIRRTPENNSEKAGLSVEEWPLEEYTRPDFFAETFVPNANPEIDEIRWDSAISADKIELMREQELSIKDLIKIYFEVGSRVYGDGSRQSYKKDLSELVPLNNLSVLRIAQPLILKRWSLTFNTKNDNSIIAMFLCSSMYGRLKYDPVTHNIYLLPAEYGHPKSFEESEYNTREEYEKNYLEPHLQKYRNEKIMDYGVSAQAIWNQLSKEFTSRWNASVGVKRIEDTLVPLLKADKQMWFSPLHSAINAYMSTRDSIPNKTEAFDPIYKELDIKSEEEGGAPYAEQALRHTFQAVIARNPEEEPNKTVKYDDVLMLLGGQGIGKSTFADDLALGFTRNNVQLSMEDKDKDSTTRRSEGYVAELAELTAMEKQSMEKIKEAISQQTANVRLPYDRADSRLYLRAVLIGTSNSTDYILKDSTGNRRFWPIEVGNTPKMSTLEVVRVLAWAKATLAGTAPEMQDMTQEEKEIVQRYYFTAEEAKIYDNYKNEHFVTASPVDNSVASFLKLLLQDPVSLTLQKKPNSRGTDTNRNFGEIPMATLPMLTVQVSRVNTIKLITKQKRDWYKLYKAWASNDETSRELRISETQFFSSMKKFGFVTAHESSAMRIKYDNARYNFTGFPDINELKKSISTNSTYEKDDLEPLWNNPVITDDNIAETIQYLRIGPSTDLNRVKTQYAKNPFADK